MSEYTDSEGNQVTPKIVDGRCPFCPDGDDHRFIIHRDELVGQVQMVTLDHDGDGKPCTCDYLHAYEMWGEETITLAIWGFICVNCGAAFGSSGDHRGDEIAALIADPAEIMYVDPWWAAGHRVIDLVGEHYDMNEIRKALASDDPSRFRAMLTIALNRTA